jgi:RNA polymerase sigma-70 factor (sigma-E family)
VAATGEDDRVRAQFEQFVRVNGDRLLHAAYGMCGDWQHGEDLVQQVLPRVLDRWTRINGDPTAYAYRCLVRATIDRWRVRRRRPEVLLEPSALVTVAAAAPGAEPAIGPGVAAALHALPPRQRAIVVLRYLQDLSEAQTAAALGISVGAVKSGASRGLARLRAGMTSAEEAERC